LKDEQERNKKERNLAMVRKGDPFGHGMWEAQEEGKRKRMEEKSHATLEPQRRLWKGGGRNLGSSWGIIPIWVNRSNRGRRVKEVQSDRERAKY